MNPLHKYAIIAGLLSVGAITSAQASQTACADKFAGGAAPNLVNQAYAPKTQELCFSGFAVMHSGLSRTALWSAEKLTAASLAAGAYIKRKDAFHAESQLNHEDRSELNDYKGSCYDRGHLAPSRDMGTEQAQHESFSLANMVPQTPRNNQHIWEGIESATRSMAEQRGTLYIITGPIFAGEKMQALQGRVLIPSHMFKAVYDPATGEMGAYLSPNDTSDQWSKVSVLDLEKSIGWDLFPGVPAQTKQKLMDLGTPTPHFANGGNRSCKPR